MDKEGLTADLDDIVNMGPPSPLARSVSGGSLPQSQSGATLKLPRSESGGSVKRSNSTLELSKAVAQFECNICLDIVVDPVVTMCGHLYCWPCLYRWLNGNNACPVCKAGVTTENVIPIYGRGCSNFDPRKKPMKEREPDKSIPHRPHGQRPAPIETQTQSNGDAGFFGRSPSRLAMNSAPMNQVRSFLGIQQPNESEQEDRALVSEFTRLEEVHQAFLSRVLLVFGSLVILVLLLI